MNQEKIGKFIAKKRKEQKLTQEQLAEKIGVSDRAVSNWENGKNMPDLSLFKPLCNELNITINELMSGEKIDNDQYIRTLEENFVGIVSNIENHKKRKNKLIVMFLVIIFIAIIVMRCFYIYYEINVKYNEKVMSCNINDNKLEFIIKGQSVLNTYHIKKIYNEEAIYFFHSTINIYNKRRSNFEYSKSMANLLDGKEPQFGYGETLDLVDERIKVYYTDYSINEIMKSNNEELNDIINKSYLMCTK